MNNYPSHLFLFKGLIIIIDQSRKVKYVLLFVLSLISCFTKFKADSITWCISLLKAMGLPDDNVVMLDKDGVIYKGRPKVDQFKSAHAADTKLRTLEEAMKGADVFALLS